MRHQNTEGRPGQATPRIGTQQTGEVAPVIVRRDALIAEYDWADCLGCDAQSMGATTPEWVAEHTAATGHAVAHGWRYAACRDCDTATTSDDAMSFAAMHVHTTGHACWVGPRPLRGRRRHGRKAVTR